MQNCEYKKQTFYSIELLITNEKTNKIKRKQTLNLTLIWLALQNDNAMFT